MKKMLLLFLFYFFAISFLNSQTIENVKFYQEGSKIMVTYDLIDDTESRSFDVSLEISRDGGITFKSTPKTISGDAGKGIKAGNTKKITWDVLKDVAELQGSNFVVKVLAKVNEPEMLKTEEGSSTSGGISPYIWIGGGALLVGGAAILLLGKKGESGGSVPDLPDAGKIPWPPK